MNRQITFSKILPILPLLVGISSCRQNMSCSAPSPLADTAGVRAESGRAELQALGIRGWMDSALSTREGLAREKEAQGSLERNVRRYRDSMRTESGIMVSPSGCVDWRGSLVDGRLDRIALVTAMTRSLVDTTANAVEWTLADSAKDPARLRVIYAIPGPNGGSLDSAVLLLGATTVVNAVELAGRRRQ